MACRCGRKRLGGNSMQFMAMNSLARIGLSKDTRRIAGQVPSEYETACCGDKGSACAWLGVIS